MARTPPDFDPDAGLLGAEGGNVSSGFEGVLLFRPWVVGGHSPYGRLGDREDGDRAERVVPGGCHLERLASAAYSASYASWPQPMWVLRPFHVSPFFQVTA